MLWHDSEKTIFHTKQLNATMNINGSNPRILDLSHERSKRQLNHIVTDSRAWTKKDIHPPDCIIRLDASVRDEILGMADAIEANPLPTVLRHPSQFKIPAALEFMREVRRRLDTPPHVAVIDGMPLDEMETDHAIAAYWVLGQSIGRNVAQKWDGTMIYHVRDTGVPWQYGVRGSYTSVELLFHNDNAFGNTLPHYVGLLCLQPAKQGGLSRFCSLHTIHNRMLEIYPSELKRLYESVFWDRQAEHQKGDSVVAWAPVFTYHGERLRTRANPSLIVNGYAVAEVDMDDETADAVGALKEVSEDPDLWFELPIERGHMQYINNIDIAHYRSEFVDYSDRQKKRHLIRTWHRDTGQVTYNG